MRKRIWALAALTAIYVCGAALQAGAAELLDMQIHGQWAAGVVSAGKEDAVRLCTGEGAVLLVLDMYPAPSGKGPGSCRMTLLERAMGSMGTEAKAMFPLTLNGRIYLDGGAIRKARFHYALEGQVAVARIEGDFSDAFWKEAERRPMLRMEIGWDERHVFLLNFFLDGFRAARRHGERLVEKVRPRRPGQEDAFGEEEFLSLILSRSWEKGARREFSPGPGK
ncbi:hypothetical protein [Mailhella massiliensis]|uniref:Uncharacterized protein n=1 Tax=Mailhella massiliensis TaxID=1903261 RepID=A0A921AWS8_9BACT|nr:hypothetical protein [Mailhella massiliensis]HJD97213.1 hypothetical protein [Mailhella massiliensis]